MIQQFKEPESVEKQLRSMFFLFANSDKKLTIDGLFKLFEMIDVHLNEEQIEEFEALFLKHRAIDSKQMMNLFSLKTSLKHDRIEVINSMLLLSKEYEKPGWMKLSRVKEILAEEGLTEDYIEPLIKQMEKVADSEGMFDIEAFCKTISK
jgi:signal recognition particle GTPase